MSRDDGFAIADTDTSMLSDPKILKLARRLGDCQKTAAAVCLYDAVRLASWRAGERLTLDETVPAWWLTPWDDLAAALVEVGLLDDEQRIPEHAWESWYGPARDRRQRYRDLGAHGNQVRWHSEDTLRDRVRDSARDRPSVPTVPTVPPAPARAPAREGPGKCSLCDQEAEDDNPLVRLGGVLKHRFGCPDHSKEEAESKRRQEATQKYLADLRRRQDELP